MSAPTASQATMLVDLAQKTYRFGRSLTGEPFAVKRGGPNVAHMLRGGMASLRPALAASFATKYKKAPSQTALADALMVLEGAALTAQPERLHLRLAAHENGIVLDLGDDSGRCLVVRPDGWTLCDTSPVLFQRTALTRALPKPERGGNIEELRQLLNVSEESWPLVLGWLLAAMVPEIPHPILLLSGEQGTAKSSAARLLSQLIDPSAAPLRSSPRDLDQWAVGAAGSWVIAVDNVSQISEWLSDALCRASTGEGLVKRRLYANDDLVVLSFRRAIVITAIDAGALRGDLADRLVIVELERIQPAERRTEAEQEAAFACAHPRMLGALLDLLAQVLAVLPDIRLTSAPRMADFGHVLAGLDRVLDAGALATYVGQAVRVAEDVVEGDLVAQAVLSFIRDRTAWSGPAADLLGSLTAFQGGKPPKGWPTTAHHLAGQLRRTAPALRQLGVQVEFSRQGRQRTLSLRTADADGDADGDAEPTQASQKGASASLSVTQSGLDLYSDGPNGDADDANDAYSHPLSLVVRREERGVEGTVEMTRNSASSASSASSGPNGASSEDPPTPVKVRVVKEVGGYRAVTPSGVWALEGRVYDDLAAINQAVVEHGYELTTVVREGVRNRHGATPRRSKRCPDGHLCYQPSTGSAFCCGRPEEVVAAAPGTSPERAKEKQ